MYEIVDRRHSPRVGDDLLEAMDGILRGPEEQSTFDARLAQERCQVLR